jgi:hypothetical protein
MARPIKDDKKIAVSIKLPPYLIEWMDRQPESRAVLIETALNEYYQIPDHIKPVLPKKKPVKRRKPAVTL